MDLLVCNERKAFELSAQETVQDNKTMLIMRISPHIKQKKTTLE